MDAPVTANPEHVIPSTKGVLVAWNRPVYRPRISVGFQISHFGDEDIISEAHSLPVEKTSLVLVYRQVRCGWSEDDVGSISDRRSMVPVVDLMI